MMHVSIRSITVLLTALLGVTSAFADSHLDKAMKAAKLDDYLEAVNHIRPAIHESAHDEDVLYWATKIYFELELLDSAVLYGARLYEEDSKEPEYVRVYARALSRSGRPSEAARILRKVNKEQPEVLTYLYLVDALTEADSLQAAELVATTAKREFPKSADAYLSLGLLYFRYKPQPVYELAIQNFEKAVELDEKLVLAHFGLAECYWKLANRESDDDLANELFNRSLTEWNTVGRLDPRNARAYFEQGKIFYLAKRYQQSVGALQRYRELRPLGTGQPIASWYLGKSFYEMQLCDSAKIHLNNAVAEIDTLKAEASMMIARCEFLSRNWAAAANGYELAAKNGSNTQKWDPKDVWYFGAALVLSGDTARAISVMTEASLRDPSECQFMFRFGLLLQRKALTSMSTKIYQDRLANCSDSLDGQIHMLIGNNFFADSLIDSAISEYKKALDASPGNGYIQARLAESYLAANRESEARALFGSIIANAQQPTASEDDKRAAITAVLKLNAADIQAKDWTAIIDRCKTGLTIDPNNEWVTLYLAVGHQGQGNVEAACKTYKKVLTINPANTTAKNNLSALGC
jgi:tetratricopeptide (TPR) repeat protein